MTFYGPFIYSNQFIYNPGRSAIVLVKMKDTHLAKSQEHNTRLLQVTQKPKLFFFPEQKFTSHEQQLLWANKNAFAG
jgi:hypothetical protein